MPALASELGVDRTRWTRAKGRYLNAKRGLYEARGRDKERAIERLDAELDALLAVPSPSPKVFGEKLRILECEYGTEAQPRHLAAIYRDARALG